MRRMTRMRAAHTHAAGRNSVCMLSYIVLAYGVSIRNGGGGMDCTGSAANTDEEERDWARRLTQARQLLRRAALA